MTDAEPIPQSSLKDRVTNCFRNIGKSNSKVGDIYYSLQDKEPTGYKDSRPWYMTDSQNIVFNENAAALDFLAHVFGENGPAKKLLGFKDIKGKIIMDLGSRDGRNYPFFQSLSPSRIISVEPDLEAVQQAKQKGLVAIKDLIECRIQNITPTMIGGRVDTIFIFNACPDSFEYLNVQLEDLVKPGGQIVVTAIEFDTAQQIASALQDSNLSCTQVLKLIKSSNNFPHKYIFIADKRMSSL